MREEVPANHSNGEGRRYEQRAGGCQTGAGCYSRQRGEENQDEVCRCYEAVQQIEKCIGAAAAVLPQVRKEVIVPEKLQTAFSVDQIFSLHAKHWVLKTIRAQAALDTYSLSLSYFLL